LEFQNAKQFALDKLKGELSEDLIYHSVEHTLDVVKAAKVLGEMEGLQNSDMLLLEIAALYHDIGFIESYEDHEDYSIKITREVLPNFGFSKEEIEIITSAIHATKIPQSPLNHIGEVLADSDLDNLGREDVFVIGQRIHSELSRYGRTLTLIEWYEEQMSFFKKHRYFTKSAIKIREAKKQENIRKLENTLQNAKLGFNP